MISCRIREACDERCHFSGKGADAKREWSRITEYLRWRVYCSAVGVSSLIQWVAKWVWLWPSYYDTCSSERFERETYDRSFNRGTRSTRERERERERENHERNSRNGIQINQTHPPTSRLPALGTKTVPSTNAGKTQQIRASASCKPYSRVRERDTKTKSITTYSYNQECPTV